MEVDNTELHDALYIRPKVHGDHRGFFVESYNLDRYSEFGLKTQFVQDNISFSATKGTLRGLHFQKEPKPQAKMIMVLQGKIYDVIVDLRPTSPTFKKWQGFVLDAETKHQLFVPRGFAHGFCTLEENTLVSYKADNTFDASLDTGIFWNSPELAIEWPVDSPVLSQKDKTLPTLSEYLENL